MQIVSDEQRASNFPVHFLRRVEIRKLNSNFCEISVKQVSKDGYGPDFRTSLRKVSHSIPRMTCGLEYIRYFSGSRV